MIAVVSAGTCGIDWVGCVESVNGFDRYVVRRSEKPNGRLIAAASKRVRF